MSELRSHLSYRYGITTVVVVLQFMCATLCKPSQQLTISTARKLQQCGSCHGHDTNGRDDTANQPGQSCCQNHEWQLTSPAPLPTHDYQVLVFLSHISHHPRVHPSNQPIGLSDHHQHHETAPPYLMHQVFRV